MIGTTDLKKIVALALCSGYVAGDRPLSLLIISDRPESGKTDIVKGFLGTPYVAFVSDISGFGLKRDFLDAIKEGKIHHIVIPELLTPLMKGKVSSQTFTTTLQVLMEDGVMGFHTGFIKKNPLVEDKAKTVGFIGCMPRLAYTKGLKREWTNSGFLSRWLVVTYKYNDDTISEILQSIQRGDYIDSRDELLKLDGETVKVNVPDNVAQKCIELSQSITEIARSQGQLYGFREAKHILSLVRANVIYDRIVNKATRTAATMADYYEIERLGYLFNEQFNALKNVDKQTQIADQEKRVIEAVEKLRRLAGGVQLKDLGSPEAVDWGERVIRQLQSIPGVKQALENAVNEIKRKRENGK